MYVYINNTKYKIYTKEKSLSNSTGVNNINISAITLASKNKDSNLKSILQDKTIGDNVKFDLDIEIIYKNKKITKKYNQITIDIVPAIKPESARSRFYISNTKSEVGDIWNNNKGSRKGVIYSDKSIIGKNSLYFDGNSEVTFGDILRINSDTTITLWINLTKDYKSYFTPLVHKDDSYQFHINTDGSFWFGSYGNAYTSNNLVWNTNQWYHCVLTWDNNTNTAHFYRDGEYISSETASDSPNGGGTFRLGHKQDSGAKLNGYIDDVRTYNKLLSDVEVEKLYNYGSIL